MKSLEIPYPVLWFETFLKNSNFVIKHNLKYTSNYISRVGKNVDSLRWIWIRWPAQPVEFKFTGVTQHCKTSYFICTQHFTLIWMSNLKSKSETESNIPLHLISYITSVEHLAHRQGKNASGKSSLVFLRNRTSFVFLNTYVSYRSLSTMSKNKMMSQKI